MLIILSPAKKLDFTFVPDEVEITRPLLCDHTAQLMEVCKQLPRADINRLMSLSDDLTDLTYQRFQNFSLEPDKESVRAAILAFRGDTFVGLNADTLSPEHMRTAQRTVRILSGLYGVLRPHDGIQAYRLEMGTRLHNPRGENLYAFWKPHISEALNADLKSHSEQIVINAASKEYSSAVDQTYLKARVITPIFQEVAENGQTRVIGLYAKRARGGLARFIITQNIDRASGLKDFNLGGYGFIPEDSDENTLVFRRAQPKKNS